MTKLQPTIHHLGLRDYHPIWQRMQHFTHTRTPTTADQIWLLQHPPVFTQGTNCHTTPRADAGGIPVVHTDRGGQITYHGPGQLVAYLLLDIKRRGLGVKSVVKQIEQVVIDLLATYNLPATRHPGAPGVYVHGAKIAALGLRIRRGCCFHGLSLNVDMDLTPYGLIDPCGFAGLRVTQMSEFVDVGVEEVEGVLAEWLGVGFC